MGGYQGVLSQQPWPAAIASLIGVAIASVLCLRITVSWTRPMDSRVGAGLALLVVGGMSIRSGGMLSVMQAGEVREFFWALAGEAAILLAIVWLVYALRFSIGGDRTGKTHPHDWATAGVQAILFAVSMWVLGKSPVKAQGICAVLASGIISGFVTHLLIGKTWQASWCVPLVVGIIGYVVNALTAGGVDIAKLSGPAAGLALATPLDYAAFGPIGMMIGDLLHGASSAETAEETAVA